MRELKPTMSLWRGKENRVWYRNSYTMPQPLIDQKISVNIRRQECYRETTWPDWHRKTLQPSPTSKKRGPDKRYPLRPCGKCLLQLWEMIWKFLKGLKIELLFDPAASVLGVRHLLAKVPVYLPSSQHYPPELRRGHGDHHWWMDKKATVMCIVILYMKIQTFATAWSNLEDIIWH